MVVKIVFFAKKWENKLFGFSFKWSWKNDIIFSLHKKNKVVKKKNVTGQDLNPVCGHIYFLIQKDGCENSFFVCFFAKNCKNKSFGFSFKWSWKNKIVFSLKKKKKL